MVQELKSLFSEKIDAIYCINLDRRSDRWEIFKKAWTPFGLPIKRFSAVDGLNIKTPESEFKTDSEWHNKFSRACTLSHIQVLNNAIDYGYDEILILEDDALPDDDFDERFPEYYKQLPKDYEFCFLGGNFTQQLELVNTNIARAKGVKTTVAYLVKLKWAQIMMDLLKSYVDSWVIDEIYVNFQIGETMHIFQPCLVSQFPSYSDLVGKPVNYGC